MSKRFTAGSVATVTGLALVLAVPAGAATAAPASTTLAEYTVVAEDGVSAAAAKAAITAAGGTVVSGNDNVGTFTVSSTAADFAARATDSAALIGASSADKAIGQSPKVDRVEQENVLAAAQKAAGKGGKHRGPKLDPLDDKLWGLEMIRADDARRAEAGDRGVKVGVLDTGVDASNPDLAANFDWRLSRNFAPDIEAIDGPCEVASCLDPVGTDDAGHGTHVAGTIGAAANGTGVSGVAPNVTLVELKGGQDSGYFFLESVVNALTYAGDAGLDVVNMSFYVDPWLYNCLGNPADSAAEQAEQRAIITAMKRALTYAHDKGVTLVGALGNNHEDLGKPRTDVGSPNYPGDTVRPRPIDNATCWDLPAEGPFVIGVSSLGPSGRKSDFSNYGVEQISVAAPGGWFRDGFGTDSFQTDANMILSSYPLKVLQEEGSVDENGNVVPDAADFVFKDCTKAGKCGYYTYLQGTSMAAPHAAGVASLIVSKFGTPDRRKGGLTLAPNLVEQHLYRTAAERACPEPRLVSYAQEGRPAEFDALCEGGKNFNGFYGYGIVDAYEAVTSPLKPWVKP
ncbi:subtilisin family serine protease [Catenuloplanes nepalensis]|uniref:Subtilisin family serine protease n=1 Tax=Catenuloplanes nepalensis TaxID=587533 RepID=A0ABT9N4J2_9ACTN|nr:S8 family serine peptidase [Catenuloplanes nepalensis]MDP9798186.1 subtilisin family serine protease [Catenuloplanes nepalensis]